MLLPIIILVCVVPLAMAAQPPQPGNASRQTSRRDIIARMQSAPQKRASGIPYADCSYTSTEYNAAVYSNSLALLPGDDDVISSPSVSSLQGCIEACRSTAGESSIVPLYLYAVRRLILVHRMHRSQLLPGRRGGVLFVGKKYRH